tara:strand:- start:6373 stop:6657 length:285 start_codon:yes stop_codon:yes gene_type:complete
MTEADIRKHSNDQIFSGVCEALEAKGPLPPGEGLANYAYIDEGHVNSLSLLEFITGLEERFDIQFSDSDFESVEFRTVGGLANLIARKCAREAE